MPESLQDEDKPIALLSRVLGVIALLFAVPGLLLCAVSFVWFASAVSDGYWGFLGATVGAVGLVLAVVGLAVGLASYLPTQARGRSRVTVRVGLVLAAAALMLAGTTTILAVSRLHLVRPAGKELTARGYDQPVHASEARWALVAARLETRSSVTGLVPVHRSLPDPASRASVLAATRDEGGYYLAAFHRDGALVRTDTWPWGGWFDTMQCGYFSPQVPEAERLVIADLGGEPDTIRFINVGNGIWVVARSGGRERGAFARFQGGWPCWPQSDRVYSGAAILRHLQHNQDHHLQGTCTDQSRSWE
jgi:hypothetical protein